MGKYLNVGSFATRNKRHRREMEDAHYCELDYMGRSGDAYFGLFDGHGGSLSAKWCAQRFHQLLSRAINKQEPKWQTCAVLASTFEMADKMLGKMIGYDGSGTTAAIVYLKSVKPNSHHPQRLLYTANVGDTRIVLCHRGKAERISKDHNCYDQAECGRIESNGGVVINYRVNGILAITRALGDSMFKPTVCSKPYTTESVLDESYDEFVIIASDGLWDVCTDQEAIEQIRGIADPHVAARTLVRHAINLGSNDNISCMIVRFIDPRKLICTNNTVESPQSESPDTHTSHSMITAYPYHGYSRPTQQQPVSVELYAAVPVAITKDTRDPSEVTLQGRVGTDMLSEQIPVTEELAYEDNDDADDEFICACCKPRKPPQRTYYHRPIVGNLNKVTVAPRTQLSLSNLEKYGPKRTPEPLLFDHDDENNSEAIVDSD